MNRIIAYLYSHMLKPILFKFDPEFVHDRYTKLGSLLGKVSLFRIITKKLFRYDHPKLEQQIAGQNFDNPIMLSAGFDKHADLVNILPSVGFAGMEVGSITWKAYEGNPKPRLYRLPKSKAIVVYYGLKNLGSSATVKKIKNTVKQQIQHSRFKMGISIAKTNSEETCELDAGVKDYYHGLKDFVDAEIGDFYTINISCPNTFGGEPFSSPKKLDVLLKKLSTLDITKPMYIKMAINLPWKDFDDLLKVIIKYKKVTGVVIGNLNKDRNDPNIIDEIPETVKGKISGRPTFELSNNLIQKTYKKYKDKLIIIGVGGVFTAEDAYTKIKLGASLVEMITGMIFGGPQVIGEINRGLVELLEKDGYKSISEAIGVDA